MAVDTTEDFCKVSPPALYFQADNGQPVTISGEALLSALSTHISQNLIPAIESFDNALTRGQLSTRTCEEELPDLERALASSLDLLKCIHYAMMTGESTALKFRFECSLNEEHQIEGDEAFKEYINENKDD